MDNIDNLIASLSKEATPLKPAPHPLSLSLKWLAAALVYLAISLFVSGVRTDLAVQFGHFWFSAEMLALLAIFITTALSAAVLAFPDLYQKRALAFAPVVMFALFVLVMIFAWHADEPPAPLPKHSFQCTLDILLFSLLPTFGIFYAMRRYASTHQGYAGSVAVLFAFSTGAIWLRLYEQTDSIIHLVEWHYLPMMVFGVIGWGLGKVLLKW